MEQLAFVPPEQYLEFERTSELRHEYVGGRTYAMAGGTLDHAAISYNINGITHSLLLGHRCRGTNGDQRIRVEVTGEALYPDATIYCPPARFDEKDKDGLLTPTVVFEVLSPSTERRDRIVKYDLYTSIPSFTDYVLVSSDRVRVEHFQRGQTGAWIFRKYVWRKDELVLDSLPLTIPLSGIYNGIDVPEGMVLVGKDGEEIP